MSNETTTTEVDTALTAYAAAGRVTTSSTGELRRGALVAAWWAAEREHAPGAPAAGFGAVMLADRRADVVDLNDRARTLMARAGRLSGPSVRARGEDGERVFAIGDVVIARRNDHAAGLFNGQRGVITHVDPARCTVKVKTNAQHVIVGPAYLAAGDLDHGYALTIHQAQGLTTTRRFVLGTDSPCREAGYVGLSRGRLRNDLYVADLADNLDPVAAESHVPQAGAEREDPLASRAHAMRRRAPAEPRAAAARPDTSSISA